MRQHDRGLLTLVIHGRGHAAQNLPCAMSADPCVRDSQCVGLDFDAFAIGPCCFDSVVVNRDVACDLNRELLDRVRLEFDAFGRVGSDPVGDVILSQRH